MIQIQQDGEKEYAVFVDSVLIGSYFLSEGIVLASSEGSPIPLDDLAAAIARLRELEMHK